METENTNVCYKLAKINEDQIKSMSAFALPDSPAAYGMKAKEVKQRFWGPLVKLVSEFNTTIETLNLILEDVKSKQSLAGSVVSAVTVQEDGKLTFTFEDDREITTDKSVKGENGDDYVLTDDDRAEIVEDVLAALPEAEEASF